MNLISLLRGCTSRIFSGFRSQCTTRFLLRKSKHLKIWRANLLSVTPSRYVLSDEGNRKPSELVRLDQFVQIHPQQLCRYAQMAPEIEVVSYPDKVIVIIGILPLI
jgi:hypothetical protein